MHTLSESPGIWKWCFLAASLQVAVSVMASIDSRAGIVVCIVTLNTGRTDRSCNRECSGVRRSKYGGTT